MEKITACRICRKAIERRSGRGRPKQYCSVECRRAGEFEVRRVNDRLGVLEMRLSTLRTSTIVVMGEDPERLQAEIALQTSRLLELLGGDGE